MTNRHAILRCCRCSYELPFDTWEQRCPGCRGPLEVNNISIGGENKGKDSWGEANAFILEKYRSWLPFDGVDSSLSLGEGNTPLTRARQDINGVFVYFKNEALNPTGSFKDRGTVAGIQRALSLGLTRVGTVSTGNMAASVAAYAARAGLRCYVFVSRGIKENKLGPIAIHGPMLVKVRGDYGQLYYHSLEIGKEAGVYFINSDDLFRVEGQKTVVYEIYEQMSFALPDYIIVPVSAGGNMAAVIKGLEEMRAAGMISKMPSVVGVQAEGCSPIARAYAQGELQVTRFDHPATIAGAIANPWPPSGERVLQKLVCEKAGFMITVTDEEILAAQKRLAEKEGIFAQPAGAAPLAALEKMIDSGRVNSGEKVVVIVSGSGLKDLSVIDTARADIVESDFDGLAAVLQA